MKNKLSFKILAAALILTILFGVWNNGGFVQAMGGFAGDENAINVILDESESLDILDEPSIYAQEVMVLSQNTTIKVEKIEDSYLYISYGEINGYISAAELSDYLEDGEEGIDETLHITLPPRTSLNIYETASDESEVVYEIWEDSDISIYDSVQYVKVKYQNTETGELTEGYVVYEELLNNVDQERLEEIQSNLEKVSFAARAAGQSVVKPTILDISEWQNPAQIDYDKIASQIELVIVRIQHGTYIDKYYKTHISEFQKRGIPVHVYAYITTGSTMKSQAESFYQKAKGYAPLMYWIDAEDANLTGTLIKSFATELRKLVGSTKVGAYIANHNYDSYKINPNDYDALWVPNYGRNNGYYDPSYNYPNWHNCDMHQYTSTGRLNGYSGDLDLSRLTGSKSLEFFTGGGSVEPDLEGRHSGNPGSVVLLTAMNLYKEPELANKTGVKLGKGTTVEIEDVVVSKLGVPVFKVKGGYYISAKKLYSQQYYYMNPGTLVLASKLNIYTDADFSKKTGKSLGKLTKVKILGVEANSNGIPRLRVAGGYISAQAKYGSAYHQTNPGSIYLDTALNLYTDVNFTAKTGKTLAQGTFVKIQAVEYTTTGVPRFKVAGGYISAKAVYSNLYYEKSSGTLTTASTLNIYDTAEFNNKTGRTVSKGSKVTILGLEYTSAGVPRLRVSGGYISAQAKYFQ